MRYFIICLFIILPTLAKAQNSTIGYTDSPINLNKESILLVPFNSKMYSSDINKKLAETNNLNTAEIIQRFSQGLDQSFLYTFQEKCNISSFYQMKDDESIQDLNYIYDNLTLEYELVSSTLEKSKAQQLREKLKKKEKETHDRGRVENGQIITQKDLRKRYMKAVVTNTQMLDSIHSKFKNNFFLFINQLDIKNDYSDLIAVQSGNFERSIELHYTLYAKDGTILTTGISTTNFSSNENDINQIIKNNFPILAQNIFKDLFIIEQENEGDSKLKLNKLWK